MWLDGNKNGIQDASETGMKNVQVQLIGCNSVSPLFVNFTNSAGKYTFPGV